MDKTMALSELTSTIGDGESLAFGGSGLVRKPMAAVASIGASSVQGLHLTAFLGGPEVDVLIGLGKVDSLHFAYVGLDILGVAPNFRRARQAGELRVQETSESVVITGLEAASRRLPFLPSRSPLATDLMTIEGSTIKEMTCPITGETLAAIPALDIHTLIIHVNLADRSGNCVIFGDAFADILMAQAAKRVFVTAELIVDRLGPEHRRDVGISRIWVDGVCEIPHGGGFTAVYPDYPTDFLAAARYQGSAGDETWLVSYIEDLRSAYEWA